MEKIMKNLLSCGLFSAALIFTSQSVLAGAKDDPLLFNLNIDKLEVRDDDSYAMVADTWLGYDLNKLRLKVAVERVKGTNENAELQMLYSRAIAPFWDLQLGVRHDIDPQPEQDWAVLGIQGTSPYFFDIDAALFIGKSGQSAFRYEAEYEQMITQRLVLIPEIELNFYGKTDLARDIGSGLASSELSLRLAYQVRREFSPYIGVTWEAKYGRSKKIAESKGEDTDNVKFVVGIQAWF